MAEILTDMESAETFKAYESYLPVSYTHLTLPTNSLV